MMNKLLVLVIIWGLIFAGCDNGDKPGTPGEQGEPPFTGLTSIDEVTDTLFWSNDGLTPDNPVEMAVKISASEWVQLFTAIKNEDKFVALDISHCYDAPQVFTFKMINLAGDKIISLVLPMGITSTSNSPFSNCVNLKEVILPEGLITIGDSSFDGCISLEKVTMPTSLIRIRGAAFRGCMSLEQIDLPAKINSIGAQAFDGCTTLALVICRAATPPTYVSNMLDNTSAALSIKVPAASVAAYKAAWSEYADKITAY
jgi:hypothetical protein